MTDLLHLLVCPHCGTPLTRGGKSLRCAAGHTFDLAKAGYVNLLPPGKEKNARTGDEKAMVRAREEFLSLGLYGGISDTLADLASAYVPENDVTVCDMGCGEGSHTCRFAGRLADITGKTVLAVGVDASKYAAERACKQSARRGFFPKDGIGTAHDNNVGAYFLPGNLFHLPLAEHSMDLALSMFAPIAGAETARILKPGGVLIVVSSGKNHLLELRERIYEDVRLSDELPPIPDGFCEIERKNLVYSAHVPTVEALQALFTMTPFYYKTTEAGRERLFAAPMPFSVTVDVNYSIFGVR